MKKIKFDVCFFEGIVMPSTMFMIPSVHVLSFYLLRFG